MSIPPKEIDSFAKKAILLMEFYKNIAIIQDRLKIDNVQSSQLFHFIIIFSFPK